MLDTYLFVNSKKINISPDNIDTEEHIYSVLRNLCCLVFANLYIR